MGYDIPGSGFRRFAAQDVERMRAEMFEQLAPATIARSAAKVPGAASSSRRDVTYVVLVTRLTKALIGAASAAALLGAAGACGSSGSFTISASSSRMRIGDYQIDRNPTYAGAVTAFGVSSSCRLAQGDPSHVLAAWRALGVVVELRTYGSLPRGRTGCTASRLIHVHTVRATDDRWHTSRGLAVGDDVQRLRHLYPSAKPARSLAEWYGHGYWLVTRRVGGYEGIGGLKPFAPVLMAETRHGRVSALVLVVGAEGD